MTQYSLEFINNSSNSWDVCVYQDDPNIGIPNVMSLAWFTKRVAPTTTVTFTWGIDYNFVWSETGELKPGITFKASQTWAADPAGNNQITLTHDGTANGAYTFSNLTTGPQKGNLYITQDNKIPLKQASTGIGMSGKGTFVCQSQPNINLIFTPHPRYWITFGQFQPGEVLDIESITNKAEIDFPPNIYTMQAILQADNTWTVQPA